MLRIAALLTLSLLVGCQVAGELEGQFRCTDNPSCPSGYQCVAGLCMGLQAGLTPCAVPDLVSTAFDDAAWLGGMNKSVPNGGSAEITGGELVLIVPADNNAQTTVDSKAMFDLRERAFVVEVSEVGGRYAEIELDDPTGADVYMGVSEGKMYAHAKGRTLAERPYSATMDRWWRLRDEASTLFWETSADGQTWVQLAQDKSPIDPAWVEFGLGIGSGGAAGTARFASVNPGAGPDARWCPAATWRDTFSNGMAGPDAKSSTGNCTISEIGGTLSFAVAPGESYCGHYTARPLDVRDAVLTFEVTPASAPATTTFSLLSADGRNHVQINARNNLDFEVRAADVDVFTGSAALDLPNQRLWRISLAGQNLRFETSADGAIWDLKGSTTVPTLDASAMFLEREVYINNSNTVARVAQFGELR
ncbi:MAG: hypothetical protein IPI49_12615 [Myxococcales bacterium]|nr:hypothetical protein [Myxococcales bacterium]